MPDGYKTGCSSRFAPERLHGGDLSGSKCSAPPRDERRERTANDEAAADSACHCASLKRRDAAADRFPLRDQQPGFGQSGDPAADDHRHNQPRDHEQPARGRADDRKAALGCSVARALRQSRRSVHAASTALDQAAGTPRRTKPGTSAKSVPTYRIGAGSAGSR
jgi:hypothetical protein